MKSIVHEAEGEAGGATAAGSKRAQGQKAEGTAAPAGRHRPDAGLA